MAYRDHEPIRISKFMGLFDRGQDETCPADHLIDALNLVHDHDEIRTRDGLSRLLTLPAIKRFFVYKRMNEASRLMILVAGGALYDSLNLATPVITIPSMVDFSSTVFFNRFYFTPHNRVSGITGEKVYVYDGTTVKQICGTAPTGTLVAANSASSGDIEDGFHLFAVSFETSSGYITKPGPAIYAFLDAPGGLKVDLSGIPIGPPGTVARHILATKSIEIYDGNQDGYEFFFAPDGRIPNNTATTLTLSFFDIALLSSADYLFDQVTTFPSCLGLTQFQGRMVAWGFGDSTVKFSKPGAPESFDGVDGFIVVDPAESGDVSNCIEFRNQLEVAKSLRSYVTQDNGDVPVTWDVISIDKGAGTEVFGISTILDSRGNNTDRYLIADRSGLLIFNGLYQRPELTWKVEKIWKRINLIAFDTIQVAHDPISARIYVSIPLDGATEPSHLLVGDISEGYDHLAIKWELWGFPWNPTSILVDVIEATQKSVLRIGSSSGNIRHLDTSVFVDDGTAIESFAKFCHVPAAIEDGLFHFGALRFRGLRGSGNLQIRLYSTDNIRTQDLNQLVLGPTSSKDLTVLANFNEERMSVRLRTSFFAEKFSLTGFTAYAKPLWSGRPLV